MSASKRAPIFILVLVLIVALLGGGGLGLLSTQIVADNAQKEINALNAETSDLTNLGAIANISGNGWIIAGVGSVHILSILNDLRNHKCCTLESDYAVPTLDTLDHIQVVLSDEKTRIINTILINPPSKSLQADIVSAYAANEELIRNVSQVFVDWSTTFGDDKRESRITSMEDATQKSLEQYTNAREKIDALVEQTRNRQDEVSTRMAILKNIQIELKTRSYVSIAALAVGILMSLIMVFIRLRSHQGLTSGPIKQTSTQRGLRKKTRETKPPV